LLTRAALAVHAGNVSRTARALEIARNTLERKLGLVSRGHT
jgi:ActR/RegA family two-component response regulator